MLLDLFEERGVEFVGQVVEGVGDDVCLSHGDLPVAQCFGEPVPAGLQGAGEVLAAAGIAPVELRVVGEPGSGVACGVDGGDVLGGGEDAELELGEAVGVTLEGQQGCGLLIRRHVERVDVGDLGQPSPDGLRASEDRVRCRRGADHAASPCRLSNVCSSPGYGPSPPAATPPRRPVENRA